MASYASPALCTLPSTPLLGWCAPTLCFNFQHPAKILASVLLILSDSVSVGGVSDGPRCLGGAGSPLVTYGLHAYTSVGPELARGPGGPGPGQGAKAWPAGLHKVASGASAARGQTQISWTIFPKIMYFPSTFCTEIVRKSIYH